MKNINISEIIVKYKNKVLAMNNIWKILAMIICFVGILIFVENDYFLYSKTIAKIDSVSEKQVGEVQTELKFSEGEYTQRLIATVKNGEYAGQTITIINSYSSSQVFSEKYEKGDCIFVTPKTKGDELRGTCNGFKRDTYFVFCVELFLFAIIIVGRKKGVLSVTSVIFNMAIFVIATKLYMRGMNIFVLCCFASVIFAVVSLLFVSGYNRKTFCAVVSTLAGTVITISIAVGVLKITNGNGVRFDQIEYLVTPDYEGIFISELLIGGLGAIMDIAITMSASLSELIEKDKTISNHALRHSGVEIGRDIMGTMVNVLFFTYVCGSVPLIVLALRNNTSFGDIMQNYISLEIVRSFVGSIGIVLSIPISINVSSHFLKRGEEK